MNCEVIPTETVSDPTSYPAFQARLRQFMEERDWKQFHNPKDMAIALSLESSALLEHFLWKKGADIDARVATHGEAIREEIADIGIYLVELCDVLGIDLVTAMSEKLDKAGLKYPVEKARGSSKKYTELEGE